MQQMTPSPSAPPTSSSTRLRGTPRSPCLQVTGATQTQTQGNALYGTQSPHCHVLRTQHWAFLGRALPDSNLHYKPCWATSSSHPHPTQPEPPGTSQLTHYGTFVRHEGSQSAHVIEADRTAETNAWGKGKKATG